MEKKAFTVTGMACEHCKTAITKALKGLDGVIDVDIDLREKLVHVTYHGEKVSADTMRTTIIDAGYKVG